MKHTLFILISLMLVGCDVPMANEDIIAEVAKCEDADYFPRVIKSEWDSRIIGVECFPIFDEDGKRIKQ